MSPRRHRAPRAHRAVRTHRATGSHAADPAARVLPSRDPRTRDLALVRDAIERIGGPLGRYAIVGRQRWWTPLQVLIIVGLTFFALGFLSKANCLQGTVVDGVATLNWSGNRQYMSACYTDIVPLYTGRGLNLPGNPYAYSWVEGQQTRYMEYPVLTGLFQGLMGWLARTTYPLANALPGVLVEATWYFILTAVVFSGLWVLVIRYTAELAGNRMWDVVLVAASPLVIVHALTNWDIPSILAAVLALVATRRGHPAWAGFWIGIGTALKLWPLFLLGALLVVAYRRRVLTSFCRTTIVGALVWAACNLPIFLAYPQAWGEFNRLNSTRPAEWTTGYQIITRLTGLEFTPQQLNAASLVLFASACVGIAVMGARARRVPRVAEVFFLIVAAFVLLNKVWSPQYSLWLVVPAVLALPRWRLLWAWMSVELLVWPATMIFIGAEPGRGLPHELFDALLLSRDGLLLAIVAGVLLQLWGKREDPVAAAHGGADPLVPAAWRTSIS